jgi:hypothetical protein
LQTTLCRARLRRILDNLALAALADFDLSAMLARITGRQLARLVTISNAIDVVSVV